jgi:putative PIN family toxin of toxin-antitoxin system
VLHGENDVARKDRIPVVFDTNLFVARLLRRKKNSINQRVFNLWLMRRRLQLIISRPILDEYLGTLAMLGATPRNLARLENYLSIAKTVTQVNLGKRFYLSRDPDDNKFLDTAYVGKAKYLVTRDKDLLDIPKADLRGLRFQIISPIELLQQLDEL